MIELAAGRPNTMVKLQLTSSNLRRLSPMLGNLLSYPMKLIGKKYKS